jgi:hypothetical protein
MNKLKNTVSVSYISKDNMHGPFIFRCYFMNYYLISEVYEWCKDNISSNWDRSENVIEFGIYTPYFADIYIRSKNDALLFKLTWC